MIRNAAEDISPQTLYEEPAWMGDHWAAQGTWPSADPARDHQLILLVATIWYYTLPPADSTRGHRLILHVATSWSNTYRNNQLTQHVDMSWISVGHVFLLLRLSADHHLAVSWVVLVTLFDKVLLSVFSLCSHFLVSPTWEKWHCSDPLIKLMETFITTPPLQNCKA